MFLRFIGVCDMLGRIYFCMLIILFNRNNGILKLPSSSVNECNCYNMRYVLLLYDYIEKMHVLSLQLIRLY